MPGAPTKKAARFGAAFSISAGGDQNLQETSAKNI
jgi:hypothetical protein